MFRIVAAFFCFLLFPSISFADEEWVFYTYDSFDIMMDAFTRLALVTASSEYKFFFVSFAIASFVFGGLCSVSQSLVQVNGKQVSYSWLGVGILGVVVFQAFINQSVSLNVYDKNNNEFESTHKIPLLVASTASFLSRIEDTMINTVRGNSASPNAQGYSDKNVSVKIINDLAFGINQADFNLVKGLKSYIESCVLFAEFMDKVEIKDIMLSEDVMGILEQAAYENQSIGGYFVSDSTCKEKWDDIKQELNHHSFGSNIISMVCKKNGFDPQSSRCKSVVNESTKLLLENNLDTSPEPAVFLRNVFLASNLARVLRESNADSAITALSNRSIMESGAGIMTVANNWFPTVRAVVWVIVLGMFPFVAIFFVTVLFPKMLKYYLGLLVWLVLWGICDVMLYQITLDLMAKEFETVRGQGLFGLWMLPDACQKAMAAVQGMRTMGIIVSGMLAAALTGLSANHMVAQFADNISSRFSSHGENAAKEILNPVVNSQRLEQLAEANATQDFVHTHGFEGLRKAKTYGAFSNNVSSLTSANMLGDGDPVAAGNLTGAVRGGIDAGATRGMVESVSPKAAASMVPSGGNVGGMNDVGMPVSGGMNGGMSGGGGEVLTALSSAVSKVSQVEAGKRVGTSRGDEGAADLQGLGVADYTEKSVFRGEALQFSERAVNEQMAANIRQHRFAHGETISEKDSWRGLARYERADLNAGVEATSGDVQFLEDYKEMTLGMDMSRVSGFVSEARAFNLSPFDIKRAQGRLEGAEGAGTVKAFEQIPAYDFMAGQLANHYHKGGEGNFFYRMGKSYGSGGDRGMKQLLYDMEAHKGTNNYGGMLQFFQRASELGLSPLTMAVGEHGAKWSMATSKEQAKKLFDDGLLDKKSFSVLEKRGGVVEGSFAPTRGGVTLTTSSVSSGQSARVDNQLTINDGSRIEDGMDGRRIMTDPDSLVMMMSDPSYWKEQMATHATDSLKALYQAERNHNLEQEWHTGIHTPVVDLLGGRVSDSVHTSESVNPLYGTNYAALEGIEREADVMVKAGELSGKERDRYIADNYLALQVHLQDLFRNASKREAQFFSLNSATKDYFKRSKMNEASRYVEANLLHTGILGSKSFDKDVDHPLSGQHGRLRPKEQPKIKPHGYFDLGNSKRGRPPEDSGSSKRGKSPEVSQAGGQGAGSAVAGVGAMSQRDLPHDHSGFGGDEKGRPSEVGQAGSQGSGSAVVGVGAMSQRDLPHDHSGFAGDEKGRPSEVGQAESQGAGSAVVGGEAGTALSQIDLFPEEFKYARGQVDEQRTGNSQLDERIGKTWQV